jgi:HAD superfamily hydrolase (TIGR01509 family)
MVKTLIFDFFGVIRADAYKTWLATNKIPHEGPYFEASLQHDMGVLTLTQFLDTISKLRGRQVTFEEIEGSTVDNQVVKIISKLSKKYQLGLISNAPSKLIRDMLAENNLEQYFEIIIVSSEVGIVKPNPEIFNLALQKLHADATESVFIDDNINHVEAAAKLGIRSIQFKSAEQLKVELLKLGVTL